MTRRPLERDLKIFSGTGPLSTSTVFNCNPKSCVVSKVSSPEKYRLKRRQTLQIQLWDSCTFELLRAYFYTSSMKVFVALVNTVECPVISSLSSDSILHLSGPEFKLMSPLIKSYLGETRRLVIENQSTADSRQILLLRTDILHKTAVGCPCIDWKAWT